MSRKPVTPLCAADAIIEIGDRFVLIERGNEPHGIAIPGGFLDLGESMEQGARREMKEETGLDVELVELLYIYSDPRRDPRSPVVTATFIARAEGEPVAGDAAKRAFLVHPDEIPDGLPGPLAFDHAAILHDYLRFRTTGERPKPGEMLARLEKGMGQV